MLNIRKIFHFFIFMVALLGYAPVSFADSQENANPLSTEEVFSAIVDDGSSVTEQSKVTPTNAEDTSTAIDKEKSIDNADDKNIDSISEEDKSNMLAEKSNNIKKAKISSSGKDIDDTDKDFEEYKNSIKLENNNIQNQDTSKVPVNQIKTYSEEQQKATPNPISWFQNPVFFLTEKIGSDNYTLSNILCNQINTSTNKVNCVLYDVDDFSNMEGYFKKGIHSDNYETTGVDGDFAVIRQDVVYSMQNSDQASDYAPLDVVAYLNGTYLIAFANVVKNSFSIEQIMIKAKNAKKVVQIGYFDERSRNIFQKYVQVLFPTNQILYAKQDLTKDTLCYDNSSIDFYVYLDDGMDENFKKTTLSCSKYITPLTFSDDTLKKILTDNSYLSMANVSGYFDLSSLLNFSKVYQNFEKEYKAKLSKSVNQEIDKQAKSANENNNVSISSPEKEPSNNTKQKSTFFTELNKANNLTNQVKPDNKKVLVKSADLARLKGRTGSLNNTLIGVLPEVSKIVSYRGEAKKEYFSSNRPVKTFGIRNVLVATRYTKSEDVIAVLDSLIQNYFDIRNHFLTPDMKKFSVSDILMGTSIDSSKYKYHSGLFSYTASSLMSSSYKTREQTIAMKVLTDSLPIAQKPISYVVPVPDANQLDIVYKKMQALNKRKSELRAIRIFQSDIAKVQKALANIKSGHRVEDSIIKFGDLTDKDIIEAVDDTSVTENNDLSGLTADIENKDSDLDKLISNDDLEADY